MLGERRSMESTPLTSLEFFGFDHLRSGYEVSITTYYILRSLGACRNYTFVQGIRRLAI